MKAWPAFFTHFILHCMYTHHFLYGCALALLCLLCACDAPTGQNKDIQVRLKDSLLLDMNYPDSLKGSSYICNYQGRPVLFSVVGYKHAVFAFEMSAPHKGQRIYLPELNRLLQQGFSDVVSFNGPDSIFLYHSDSAIVCLANAAGEIKRKWPINLHQDGMEHELYSNTSYDPVPFDASQPLLFFNDNVPSGYTPDIFIRHRFFAAVRLADDSARTVTTFGALPESYIGHYYGFSGSSRNLAYFNHRLLASYYLSDSLYACDPLHPENPLAAYDASSSYVTPSDDQFDESYNHDHSAMQQFGCEHATYAGIFTRPDCSYLFRKINHKYPYYNRDSTVNMVSDLPFSVVVLDRQLKKLGEIQMPARKVWGYKIIPNGKGFWVPAWEQYNKLYYYEMEL